MNHSKKRIMALLSKDFKEYLVLIFLFPVLSIAMFYLPSIFISNQYKIAIVSQQANNVLYQDANSYEFFQSKEEAIEKLNLNKVHAVIDVINKTVDMNDQKTVPSKEIQKAIDIANGTQYIAQEEKADYKNLNISALIGSILLTISCFIAGPIIFLGEKSTKTYHALLLTPLTYNEYILSKTLICVITNMGSVILFQAVTYVKSINAASILYVFIASLFMSIISGIISSLFTGLDKAMIYISPLMLLLLILDFNIWLGKIKPIISIQSGLKHVMEFQKLDWKISVSLLLLTILGVSIFRGLCKKSILWNTAN